MAELCREAIGLLVVVNTDPLGGVVGCEAVGVASTAEGCAIDLRGLRERATRLSSIPMEGPVGQSLPIGARKLSELDPDWRSGSMGELWGELARSEIAVGTRTFSKMPGRVLQVQVAPQWTSGTPTPCIAMMEVALPHLMRYAERALGSKPFNGSDSLSSREQDVLEHLLAGRSNKEISAALSISAHTVHDYVKSLHRKLGVRSRGELLSRVLHITPSTAPGQIAATSMAQTLADHPEQHAATSA
jgi:DNA-binding CsgD family transcriptional regulator